MPTRRQPAGMNFKKAMPRRQGLTQHVQPQRGTPQRASNANPRRKH